MELHDDSAVNLHRAAPIDKSRVRDIRPQELRLLGALGRVEESDNSGPPSGTAVDELPEPLERSAED
jgi:hypothetical protein